MGMGSPVLSGDHSILVKAGLSTGGDGKQHARSLESSRNKAKTDTGPTVLIATGEL
jgi:hypothetical protein